MHEPRHPNTQQVIDSLKERLRLGEITAAEANVRMIQAERVRLIRGPMPRDVRSALNAAVKAGRLGHLKKDGFRPEAYFDPDFEYLAKGERAEAAAESRRALECYAGIPE